MEAEAEKNVGVTMKQDSFCECDGISQLLCVTKEDISADILSAVGEVYWLFQCRNKPTSWVGLFRFA